MNILIVDDEALARQRLRVLLADMPELSCQVIEAAAVSQALDILQRTRDKQAIDVLLLDIQMPGMDGVALARQLRQQACAPAVIFVTAHAEHASQAFDLDAADYLTKPVRLERLRQALRRALLLQGAAPPAPAPATAPQSAADADFIIVNERHRTERVPVSHILFCRAEQKYVTVQTLERQYLYDGSLNELETRFGMRFLRVHRNALAARQAMRGLVKACSEQDGEHWLLELHGTQEALQVSRRQLPLVRAELLGRAP
ncbi:DNA-binding response regulator [Corticibacter populi]|uniref:DNA-binding response regulator n=1 Tax=Corticibacter populi TaxID=1550736 RepID=A0A3M6QPP5_9BURK|nr:LytTR family DNA-binding domain-containing protein [Corticibacter populi]RMX05008.1 DNA-binding response regulator [Corticibacter populi]